MKPKSYIVILNYNGWKDTIECLESVLKLDYPNFQIVVVDNNSPNDSMPHMLAWAKGEITATVDNPQLSQLSTPHILKPVEYIFYDKHTAIIGGDIAQESELINPIIFIQSGENNGFAAGNNVGTEYVLKKSDSQFIWYLNNDTVVETNSLSEYIKKAQQYKINNNKVGIIGAKLMYYHQPKLIQAIGGKYNKWLAISKHIGAYEEDKGQYDNEEITKIISYPVGASMFVNIDFIKDVGLMSEDYFLYFEELDWVCRGENRGWSVGFCYSSKIYHKEGSSISGSNNKVSLLSDYHSLKNKFKFTRKFYPNFMILIKISYVFVLFNRLKRLEFRKLIQAVKVYFEN